MSDVTNESTVASAAPVQKFKYPTPMPPSAVDETEISKLEKFLEKEKGNSHNESWNKLDTGIKMQKLHAFAEHHGHENKLSVKEIKQLKMFFNDCLDKNKLKKTKDVVYDKSTGLIQSVPALAYNSTTRNFTLKNTDNKRVSTLKSLTPKKNLSAAAAAAASPPEEGI